MAPKSPVILHKGAYDFSGDCIQILIIGGVNGTDGDCSVNPRCNRSNYESLQRFQRTINQLHSLFEL